MKKILVICGPTAAGKTRLGILLAKKFSGEIVSADSRQVYRGMDVSTGKDLPVNSKLKAQSSKQLIENRGLRVGYYLIKRVRVWLYDLVEPDYLINVADWVDCAKRVVEDIWTRGKLPIVVGGTGFYIKALIDGVETIGVKPDWELREKLSKLAIEQLGEKLKEMDLRRWERMNESDRMNPRRLVRAIEIIVKSPKFRPEADRPLDEKVKNIEEFKIEDALMIGLTAPLPFLLEKIKGRVDYRYKQGIKEEIRNLLAKGFDWGTPGMSGLGYRQWRTYFEKKISEEKTIEKWRMAEVQYAKRQLTWFKKDKRIKWFGIDCKGWEKEVEKQVGEWYIKSNVKISAKS